ncbi:MAG: hypothetical protein LQ341_003369 [Variospora aurantia]|nr:MAG: hypothetical protein LQ341_003369 [Variospora aurantia]
MSSPKRRIETDDVRSALPSATAPSVLPRVIWIDMTGRLMSDYEVTLVNDNTPFAGGLWKIHVELPDQYPYKSPSIGFVNRIFHPNIDELSGSVCLDVINQTWSPMFDMINIFEVFLPQLLRYPNPTDPLNGEAAALLMRDPKTYDVKVKDYVTRYASKEAADDAGDDSDDDDGMSSVGDFESGDEEPAGQMEFNLDLSFIETGSGGKLVAPATVSASILKSAAHSVDAHVLRFPPVQLRYTTAPNLSSRRIPNTIKYPDSLSKLTMTERQVPVRSLYSPTLLPGPTSELTSRSDRAREVHHPDPTRIFRVPSPTPSEEAETSALEEAFERFSFFTKPTTSALETGVKLDTEPITPEKPTDLSKLGDSSSLFSHVQDSPIFQFGASSTVKTRFTTNVPAIEQSPRKMVVEREPPKVTLSPHKVHQSSLEGIKQPEFGKASPLHNRLLPKDVFNVPKSTHTRPEHHRPVPSILPPLQQVDNQTFKAGPLYPSTTPSTSLGREPDLIEIPKPEFNVPWPNKAPVQPPWFSSQQQPQSFASVNPQQASGNFIDLTKVEKTFDPDAALFDNRFGATDPYTYVDASKASENIKALLEGAFDDEEDKPRTRGRTKKVEAKVASLSENLKDLGIEKKSSLEEAPDESDHDEDDGTVEGLNVKLLPHQVVGVEWMKDKEARVKKKMGVLPKGGILADDMGMGKTIQSISLMLQNPRPPKSSSSEPDKKTLANIVDKGTLVVAPLALIKQWEAEIKNRVAETHKLRVCVHHGPQRTKRFEDLRKYDVVITTYQILVSEHGSSSERDDGPKAGCFGLHWYRVILDEAHTIKNRNAKATQACNALCAEYRWCLTGTPMQNNLDELQSLIKFLRIKPYNDLAVWRDQITRPLSQGRGGIAMRRLQYYLKAFMKRRTKDVLRHEGALNPGGKTSAKGSNSNGFKITERKIESVEAEFSPEEREFYARLEQRTDKSLEQMMGGEKMNYASALVLLLRLRQACNHPKLVGGNMANDRDALTTGQGAGTQSPRKSKVVDKEIDDLADLLGGVSVVSKQCDVCLLKLSEAEVTAGSLRCHECEEDIQGQDHPRRMRKKKAKPRKPHGANRTENATHQKRQSKNRKVVLDDSDDEADGSWLVSEEQRQSLGMGKAGGTDDENAEGGGESLASEDSLTGDESEHMVKPRKDIISLNTTDEEGEEGEEGDSEQSLTEDDEDERLTGKSSSSDDVPTTPSPTSSAKIKHLLKVLQRECAQHKFIVFSQFTSMLDLIEPFLRAEGLVFTRYDGSMRNDLREASLERLRNDKRTRILLCSLKCGSLGLNLTAASRVVILEPFWNPFVEEQAIDRVHRLNQTVDVTIYKFTVSNTVEARILELQEKKRSLAAQAIEGGGNKAAATKLSMKDILNLFRRDAEHDYPSVEESGRREAGAVGKRGGLLSRAVVEVGEGVRRERAGMRLTPPVMERGAGARREEASNFSLPPSEPVNCSTTKHLPGDGKVEKLSALKFGTEDHLREIWDGQERKRKGIGGRNGPLQLLDLSVDVLKVIINEYTSKFSLGNGPQEWIKEYLINRDSGKMLGTLVALALERMPMLQDFTWDMPTGILRDCWLALAPDPSIGSSPLQRVWVRFHDNREIMDAPQILPTASQGNHYSPGNPPGPSQTQSSNYYFNGIQCPSPLIWSYRHIEWPNFSVLPSLRSLNVLNIDEIAYLEEMGVLIERSMGEMRELRIGLADKVPGDGFASTRDLDFPVVDEEPTEYESALRRLMSKLLEVEEQDCPKSSDSNALPSPVATTHVEEPSLLGSQNLITNPRLTPSSGHEASKKVSDDCTNLLGGVPQVDSTSDPAGVLASLVIKAQVNPISNKSIPGTVEGSTASSLSASSKEDISHGVSAVASDPSTKSSSSNSNNAAKQDRDEENCNIAKWPTSVGGKGPDRTQQEKRLRLEILELEYMHVDFGVLLKTIDWSVLTTLTLLHCDSSEGLWRALRRAFTPRPMPSQPILRRKSKMQLRDFSSKNLHGVPPSEYQLSLRRIHINSVSAALIAFLRETLAPDSLELLFLQDGGMVSNSSGGRGPYDSNVSIEAIFNGPLRRHRRSLKKLMIDSDDRPVNSRRKSAKWQKWRLDRNMLAFVTSAKLSVLRELAISIDYQDWHFFLQRLPQVPHIRSIYLRHGADHPHEQHFNAKELALQLMDIVSIRPEMELCYLGIANKCFEIIEGEEAALPVHGSLTAAANPGLEYATSTDEDSDEGEDDDDDDENEDGQTAHAPDDSDVDSQPERVEFSEDEGTGLDGFAKLPRLELREILFYDDKISIFKARHSKL